MIEGSARPFGGRALCLQKTPPGGNQCAPQTLIVHTRLSPGLGCSRPGVFLGRRPRQPPRACARVPGQESFGIGTMDAGIIVLATVAVAGWTWVVTDLDEKGRRSIRARSVALLIGIWFGFLAAIALHLVRELAGSEWLEAYEWPLALAVCAIEYVRRTYKAEHASPKS